MSGALEKDKGAVTLSLLQDAVPKVYNASLLPCCGTQLLMQVDLGNNAKNGVALDDSAESEENLIEFLNLPNGGKDESNK